jgi:hypothetical protein
MFGIKVHRISRETTVNGAHGCWAEVEVSGRRGVWCSLKAVKSR